MTTEQKHTTHTARTLRGLMRTLSKQGDAFYSHVACGVVTLLKISEQFNEL